MPDAPEFGRPVPIPSGRLVRSGRFGALALGVGARVAAGGAADLARGRRPVARDLILTPGNMRRVADELARMRGAAMKLGQLLSLDTGDVLPPEMAQIMARLRAEADFMPPKQLKAVLAAEWPRDWLKQFSKFDVRPIAAASIGQVHRAVHKGAGEVAVKIQYPGVARSIDSDVANVAMLARMSGLLPKGFDLAPYVEEARQQLHAETEYGAEAAHLTTFGGLLEDDDRFTLPVPVQELTTRSILTMTWIDSRPLEFLDDAPQAVRDEAAERLFALLFREMFEFRLIQSDPNPANFRYQPATGRIVLLDFGATRALAPDTVERYRTLMRAGLAGDAAGLEASGHAIGFLDDNVREADAARILAMMDMVFAPLRQGTYDFGDTTLTRRLQQEGMALGESGFVPPPLPMDALFLQRKVAGLFLICARIGARVDVGRLLEPYLEEGVVPAPRLERGTS